MTRFTVAIVVLLFSILVITVVDMFVIFGELHLAA
jgi:hypothetical protein